MDEELTRFSISNESIKDAQGNLDLSILSKWKSMVGEMTKALESSVNSIVKVTTKIDSAGNAITHFDVPRKMSDIAQASLSRTLGHAENKYGLPQGAFIDPNTGSPATNAEQYRRIYFNKSFYGADAQRELKRAVEEAGGTVARNPSKQFKDRYRIGFSVSEREYAEALQRFDNDESKARESLTGRFVRSNLAVASKFSSDANARTKEKTSSLKKAFGTVTAILSAITIVANITRRLLTAVLDRTSQMQKDAVTAKSLGISYGSMRQYNATEIGMGMQQGTFTGAIGSLQSAFGDITHLDEKALGELAKVMGGGVLGAIQTGLGQNDPQALMESILNAYFERGQKGINSIGQRVGQYQAERELATSLEKAGLKEIAEILRMMFYQQDTGINKGSIRADGQSSYKDFMSIVTTYTMGNTRLDMKQAQELSQVIDTLKSRLNDLSDSLSVIVLQKLARIINWLDNWDFGKSSTERAVDVRKRIATSKEFVETREEEKEETSKMLNSLLGSLGIKIDKPVTTPSFRYRKDGKIQKGSFTIKTPADLALAMMAYENRTEEVVLGKDAQKLYNQYSSALKTRQGKAISSLSRMLFQQEADIEYGQESIKSGKWDKTRGTEAGFVTSARSNYNSLNAIYKGTSGSAYLSSKGEVFYNFLRGTVFDKDSGSITPDEFLSLDNVSAMREVAKKMGWNVTGKNDREFKENFINFLNLKKSSEGVAITKAIRDTIEEAGERDASDELKKYGMKIPNFTEMWRGSIVEGINQASENDIEALQKIVDFQILSASKLPKDAVITKTSISEYDERTRTQTIRLEYKNLSTGETGVLSNDIYSEGGTAFSVDLPVAR